ncbi:hypothetical protein ACM66B_006242 [Microbotryomycetes sp. NB124-2]
MPGAATCDSLRARHDAIVAQYHQHLDIVNQVQAQCEQTVVPELQDELEWDDDTVALARAFVRDQVTVFRFCRRARFAVQPSIKLVQATLLWRFKHDSVLRKLTPNELDPLYTKNALFFFHPQLVDKFGRPCAVINLRHVQRTEDGQLDALKDVIRLGWEVGRRWLTDLSTKAKQDSDVKLQIVVIVDLDGAGMSNLEVELLPFFMELLKNHFPGMIGAIFVLNYGWMYAGMWQLAKRVLPNTALERILFPTKQDLLEFFDEQHLLKEHGGQVEYTYSPDNPVLAKYGLPLPPSSHAYPSPSPSPSASSTSLSSLASSSGATGGSVPRRSSRLSMTSLNSHNHNRTSSSSLSTAVTPLTSAPTSPYQPDQHDEGLGFKRAADPDPSCSDASQRQPPRTSFWNWGRRRKTSSSSGGGHPTGLVRDDHHHMTTTATSSTSGLRRVASLAELQEKLAETQRAIDSDDSELSDEIAMEEEDGFEQDGADDESLATEPDRYEVDDEVVAQGTGGSTSTSRVTSAATSARSSRFSSRVPSRNVSRQPSREGSPRRRILMSGAPGDGSETLSSRARFAGSHSLSPYNSSNPYWGYPAFVQSSDPSRIPRPHYQRRRKRDLVRTLTYLAVLRFLALHRSLRNKVKSFVKAVLTVLGLVRRGGGGRSSLLGGQGQGNLDRGPLLEQVRSLFASSTVTRTTQSSNTAAVGSSLARPPSILAPGAVVTADVQSQRHVHWDTTSSHHLDGTRRPSYIGDSSTSSTSSTIVSTTDDRRMEPYDSLSEKLEQYVWIFIWFTILRTPNRLNKLEKFVKLMTVDLPVWFVERFILTSLFKLMNRVYGTNKKGESLGRGGEKSWEIVEGEARVIKRMMASVGQKLIEWSK